MTVAKALMLSLQIMVQVDSRQVLTAKALGVLKPRGTLLLSKHAKDKAKTRQAQEAATIILPLLTISLEHRLLDTSLLRDLLA